MISEISKAVALRSFIFPITGINYVHIFVLTL